jgi:3-hydroxyisobutyrate dehydrogenase-like beta-hydroxyacid dehydrogenase
MAAMTQRAITVGLLNPGEMGAAVGKCLTGHGHRVLWASDGRSEQTADRAKAAGLDDAGMARDLAAKAGVILSVCPPHAALDVAWAVHGFTGVYVDANAVAPGTARQVADLIAAGGGRYVDGGIIGSPPVAPGASRLYLSGDDESAVRTVHDLFAGTALEPRVVAGPATAASAVKMAYAAWTKGSSALLLAARALARAEGVEDALLAEWALSQPRLTSQVERSAGAAATKGWRWVGEMEEIAQTMASAGLPNGFHEAAAEIFRRSPRLSQNVVVAERTATAVVAAIIGDTATERNENRP